MIEHSEIPIHGFDLIRSYVESFWGLGDITIKSRKSKYIFARYSYYEICLKYTDASYKEIANSIGIMQHGTLINSITRIRGLRHPLRKDAEFCIKAYSDSRAVVIADAKCKPLTPLHKYIRRINSKALEAGERLKDEIKKNIPFYEAYQDLPEEQKREFDIMAEAKLRMLKVKHEIK